MLLSLPIHSGGGAFSGDGRPLNVSRSGKAHRSGNARHWGDTGGRSGNTRSGWHSALAALCVGWQTSLVRHWHGDMLVDGLGQGDRSWGSGRLLPLLPHTHWRGLPGLDGHTQDVGWAYQAHCAPIPRDDHERRRRARQAVGRWVVLHYTPWPTRFSVWVSGAFWKEHRGHHDVLVSWQSKCSFTTCWIVTACRFGTVAGGWTRRPSSQSWSVFDETKPQTLHVATSSSCGREVRNINHSGAS